MDLHANNAGGFYCGGVALSLASVYRLMGYESFGLDLAVLKARDHEKIQILSVESVWRPVLARSIVYSGTYPVNEDPETIRNIENGYSFLQHTDKDYFYKFVMPLLSS